MRGRRSRLRGFAHLEPALHALRRHAQDLQSDEAGQVAGAAAIEVLWRQLGPEGIHAANLALPHGDCQRGTRGHRPHSDMR